MRRRALSSVSSKSSLSSMSQLQELDDLYDYISKVILLGASGTGKSCILHRFVRNEWRGVSSQTIGVEFSSKIVKVTNSRTNVKLQLWDTAGQERFRSLTRGYYRGSAGILLIFDICDRNSFSLLQEFLNDVRSLAHPNACILLIGNKSDKAEEWDPVELVNVLEIQEFCHRNGDIAYMETSAKSGFHVDDAFQKLTDMIYTKVELGQLDPSDPDSGVQYGDIPRWDGTLPRGGSSVLSLIGGRGGVRGGQSSSQCNC